MRTVFSLAGVNSSTCWDNVLYKRKTIIGKGNSHRTRPDGVGILSGAVRAPPPCAAQASSLGGALASDFPKKIQRYFLPRKKYSIILVLLHPYKNLTRGRGIA